MFGPNRNIYNVRLLRLATRCVSTKSESESESLSMSESVAESLFECWRAFSCV